ncbi:general transcription factor 3C polypeptide 1 [Drosophila subobscura]|uniref:general transcription factor 3C polypeptide 1 n=1 Tax=Drosophila subobscura TaxID=7241 RepID=UPI00155A3CC0|nr:general transcription factor 3C polypeptide 1 [Drosophila subobscura]
MSATTEGSWINAIFDEIALEGLEGVTLPDLWRLLAVRLEFDPAPLPVSFRDQVWTLLLRSCPAKVQFYELPSPRPFLPPYDRANDQDPELGVAIVAEQCPYLLYRCTHVQEGNIIGSCENYKTRKRVEAALIRSQTAAQATEHWDQRLVAVASQELRHTALTPINLMTPKDMTVQQYVCLEAIGRSRYNGLTTVGPYGLINYCKDASVVFYIKNKLLSLQLIAAQVYNERHKGRFTNSSLLMLPRFFRVYKSHTQKSIDRLYLDITQSSSGHIPMVEVPERLGHISRKQVKKLLLTHNIRKFFETSHVPRVAPEAASSSSSSSGKATKEPKPSKRKQIVLKLRKPGLAYEELYEHDQEIREEKQETEFLNHRHSFVDMPPELECHRAIARFGKRGLTASELCQYVGIGMLAIRGFLKHLMKHEQVKDYTEQVGRIRVIRYVAKAQAPEVELKKTELKQTLLQLQCKDEPTIPESSEGIFRDTVEIVASVNPFSFKMKDVRLERQTQRHLRRKEQIVKLIDGNCIVHLMTVSSSIKKEEHKAGFKDILCRRSLYRVLRTMIDAGIVNVHEVTLQYGQRLRLYRLVTHPKIDADHELIRREILRLKSQFHLMSEERLQRPSQLPLKERKQLLLSKKQNVGRQKQQKPKIPAPKLLLARTLHDFLFYVIYELPKEQKPLEMTAELVEQWQKMEPALETRQFLDEWRADETPVLPYNSEISWRTFIPPLPSYVDKPPGWVFFMDAMDRMPLSLLLRICRIEREDSAERLRLPLKHPIRQHYLLAQLKLENIVSRSRLQKLYARTLCLLNHMGLIQVSDLHLGRDSVHRWVYLNKRARLLDTTASSEHNYQKVSADRTYMELRFEFQNRDQLAQYWAKLQHICVYTKLGFRKDKKKPATRVKPLSFFGPERFDQAAELDNGTVPGDQLGAAGLSSLLFAHQFRNWSWVQTKPGKSGAVAAAGALKTRKLGALTRIKVTPKLPIRRTAGGTGSGAKAPRRKCGPRDDIDRDAMRNMRTLRVRWLPEEDRVLKMGRAVYLFFDAPVMAFALNNVGLVCRDIIRRYLGICNKTTQACVRRLQFLMRMKRDAPDVPSWIYMMQTQPQFNSIYNERFMSSLRREYATKSEQNDALLVHFVLVLNKLHQTITNSHGTVRNQFMLPDTVAEYRSQLSECSRLNDDQQVLYSNPSTETELQVAIAHGVLHSQVCCARDKTLFNLQTFEIYKHFSEEVLNTAFNKARADSLLVAVKRRNIHAASNRQISGPAHVLSSKYKYRLTYLKLAHTVLDGYFEFEQKLNLEKEVHLPSPHFAQLLLLGEWMVKGKLRLSLHLPANILTVDTTSMSRPSGSSTDRILDHYSCILDNAPQTEYSKRLESECSSRQASRVRFHPANLSYRIQSCPYIQLSKLPLRVMHFFCALDALGDSVTISSARLEQGDCPFANCIMRSGNYLNAVERIVHEQRTLLKQLVADALPQSQFQLEAHSAGTALTVSVSNILALTQQLEAYWRQQQQKLECKDLGKLLSEKTLHKLTDWRALCSELIDYEAHIWEAERSQEFEPAMNKEERARVQDVFVVHLPAIGMHAAQQEDLQQAKQSADSLRTAVLAKVLKATYWHYTEKTFETLLPALKERNYDSNAIRHMEDILNYIERQPLGVPAMELRETFPLGDFLLEALHVLEDHELIKRVGVASHMYVHKRYIRNWVVHTFHIKRLERERVQTQVAAAPGTMQAVIGQKRKEEEQHTTEEASPPSKKIKLSEPNSSDSESDELAAESVPKRPRRTTKKDPPFVNALRNEASHDAIVMRPQPWIRLNASLNRRVLDRWMGAVLSECISRMGCTVHSLFLRFPYLVPVDVMFLLELLTDLGCLHLMELQTHKVHVETTQDEQCGEQPVTELYEPKLTYIIVRGDAIGRLTSFIGRKKYSTEFM